MHIRLKNVSKRYSNTWALRDVSLEILPGQIVTILGPNGAGKSTLLRCLAGLICPSRGEVLFDHQPFSRKRIDLRQRFLFLPDFPMFFSTKDIITRLGIAISLYGKDRNGIEERVFELLREFDLLSKADSNLLSLSRGQAYKASLVALLAIDPEVWILDEPMASGMDPLGITSLKRHIRDAIGRGRTVLYTTQILDIAESFSDRVCILDEGKVKAFDSISNLRREMGGGGNVLETLFKRLREESP